MSEIETTDTKGESTEVEGASQIDKSFAKLVKKQDGYDLSSFKADAMREADEIKRYIKKFLQEYGPATSVTAFLLLITVAVEIAYSFRLDIALLNVISLVKLAFVYVLCANYFMPDDFEIMKLDLPSYIAILTAFEFIIFTVLPSAYTDILKLYLIFSALSILLALIFQGIIDLIHDYKDNLDSLTQFKVRLARIDDFDKIEGLLVKYNSVLSIDAEKFTKYKVPLIVKTLGFVLVVVVAVVISYYLSFYY